MTNVFGIQNGKLTPKKLCENILAHTDEYKDLYVVALDFQGSPSIWATGDLGGMALATSAIQDLTIKFLNGQVIDE